MSETVAVAKEELDLLRRAMTLLNRMADHPEKGTEFKRLAKSVDNTLRFTDLETVDRVQAPVLQALNQTREELAAMKAEREQERQTRAAEEQARRLSGDIGAAARKFGLTDDGRAKMEARMQEKGNLDAEAAAAWVAAQQPRAMPNEANGALSPAALNLYGIAEKEDRWAGLNENPDRFLEQEATAVMREFEEAARVA